MRLFSLMLGLQCWDRIVMRGQCWHLTAAARPYFRDKELGSFSIFTWWWWWIKTLVCFLQIERFHHGCIITTGYRADWQYGGAMPIFPSGHYRYCSSLQMPIEWFCQTSGQVHCVLHELLRVQSLGLWPWAIRSLYNWTQTFVVVGASSSTHSIDDRLHCAFWSVLFKTFNVQI